MLRRLRTLLVAAVALVAAGCASFGSFLEPPEVSVAGIEALPSGGFEQRFRVQLRLSNPNDRSLAIDGLRFRLEVNGQPLMRGQTGDAVLVPRLGDAVLAVDATTTLLDVVRQVIAIQQAQAVRYRVTGRVYLQGWLPPALDFENEDELVTLPSPDPTPAPPPRR